MKRIAKKTMEAIAKVGMNTAIKAAGATSFYGCHQPAEPKALKSMLKK
ncbi:MAG: cyclic lactone autoinducer peptide [Oscillospiraceae bacterium]